MALNAAEKKSTKKSTRVPQPNIEVGSHAARLVQVIDLGLQPQKPYKGTVKEPVDMLYVTYELSHVFMLNEKGEEEPDRPRWISEDFAFYSLKADKAKSTERYNALDAKKEYNGDWTKLVGAPCNVLVVHNPRDGKVYDNVGSVSPAVKLPGYVQPDLKNPPLVFDLSAPDLEVFNKLPEFLQLRIKGNLNYQGSKLQALLGEAATAPATNNESAPNVEANQDEDNPY
jgi:hypothetical protein